MSSVRCSGPNTLTQGEDRHKLMQESPEATRKTDSTTQSQTVKLNLWRSMQAQRMVRIHKYQNYFTQTLNKMTTIPRAPVNRSTQLPAIMTNDVTANPEPVFQTCKSILGTLLFAQCAVIESNITNKNDVDSEHLYLRLASLSVQLHTWKTDRRLLGPDMEWTTHFSNLNRPESRADANRHEVLISCNRQRCTSLFSIKAVLHFVLCGESRCKPNTNGTAIIILCVGN